MNAHADITATAEVHVRSKVKVEGIRLRGKVSSQELVRGIIGPIENEDNEVYAVRIAVPSHIPGAADILTFSRTGKKLETRRYYVSTMPDEASHSLSAFSEKVGWVVLGVFTSKSLADTVGNLWATGVIEIDFGK
ncbi:MAG: hypothetical protein DI537_05520 [Stutzerimonas stutzeri]|nr:MAG: hypothetical protein DI537_05520 [Stutzerimonas stutzeri]